jgi:hypothetical protein
VARVSVSDWYLSLPPAETSVPCGGGLHTVRWEAGKLALLAHPDAEAELVLGALGGEKPACIALAETWDRHSRDLAVLMAGPRSAADHVMVTWEQLREQRARLPQERRSPGRAREQLDLLELLALGPEFQFRLSGTVAAAWAERADAPQRTGERAWPLPELAAALTGRFAPVAAEWLGIDPDAVIITPHDGPGWGTLALTSDSPAGAASPANAPSLTGTLPVGWLADVWACGLALADGHLVVSVTEPGYPRAKVLTLPEPGASPVPLEVNR